ncbi:MAG TPA: ribonuclease P protein component [Dehalococcoidia bacterium]|nr:ribonuclease P protein component [Dehalococcoidia bacterium]
MGLPWERRLRQRRRFEEVYRRGRTWTSRWLVLKALPGPETSTRIGIAVGKALGPAVLRHKIQRRLREALRPQELALGWDLVLIARPPLGEASFSQVSQAVTEILERAHLAESQDQ